MYFKYIDHLLPLALSHFLPSHLTRGAVCESFWPGYKPKCLFASLSLGPLKSRTFLPVGAIWANWSKVKHSPFACAILALAAFVNLRAQTLRPWGREISLLSFVTVPTTATILEVNLSGLSLTFLFSDLLKNLVTALITLPSPEACSSFLSAAKSLSLESILEILEREIGYLLSLDWFNLLWMVVLNLQSVLLERKA